MLKNINLKDIFEILPGLLICIAIAYLGKFMAIYMPSVGAGSLAIFIGMAVGNTFGNRKELSKGTKFSESNLLFYSIILLGGTLSAQTLMELGLRGVTFIIIQMSITIIGAIFIGKKLGFSENFRYLMASGNAVCGSSAIAATAPVINADDKDKGITITIVNVTGTVLMLLLPLLGKLIFSLDTLKTSALIGGVLQSVGQVVASGSLVNEGVKDLATVFKIVRIIFLVVVVIVLGNLKNRTSREGNLQNKSSKGKIVKIPWYVIGFFIMCFLFTIGIISPEVSKMFKKVSNIFEIIALAGIGMRVNFRELLKQGARASYYAITLAAVQIICAISLISILLKK
ncbi:hypothetical protein CLHOM_15580 [Clostridium homopropionicum DSM 5847]|uniref:Sulfate exporter family transporter n=1 Tax=Clostridium homopropionicum DSM 5847 TaxID=1121318 RepID=A0A0L6ZB22_9CLOT|nr:putative sulfate exporter family transporter [Clostridium homopropionicum]KOA19993.1 hypothetical protein CLHOM_15580 [Clostridium homopropionicum DSM 5847]SFG64187.1 conserved hypothetical integral membrane protein [Clostridium homopropionicum]